MIDLSKKSKCIEGYHASPVAIAVAEENGKSFRLKNQSRWSITKYKGECLSTDNSKACDYLLYLEKEKSKRAFLVELKGNDVEHAVKQLGSTLTTLKITSKSGLSPVNGRIIPTKTNAPDLRSSQFLRLRDQFMELNGTLKVQSRQMIEVI